MKKKWEIIQVIKLLQFKARKGLINKYEASLCIGALQWVLKDENFHTKWFEYRTKEEKGMKNEESENNS